MINDSSCYSWDARIFQDNMKQYEDLCEKDASLFIKAPIELLTRSIFLILIPVELTLIIANLALAILFATACAFTKIIAWHKESTLWMQKTFEDFFQNTFSNCLLLVANTLAFANPKWGKGLISKHQDNKFDLSAAERDEKLFPTS